MIPLIYHLVSASLLQLLIVDGIVHHHRCQFAERFYDQHPDIFQLNSQRNLLKVQALYDMSNESALSINQSLSIGIIYRIAKSFLVPVPLLFQCSSSDEIYSVSECQMTIVDRRFDLSERATEATRTSTVMLNYVQPWSSKFRSLRGAYFKESIVTLRNCRLTTNEIVILNETFRLRIEFEQTIGSPCLNQCSHSKLYQCSSLTKTCQCQTQEFVVDALGKICVDNQLNSNCSLSPERCRRFCRIDQQILRSEIDRFCLCPPGSQRVLWNNFYRCETMKIIECQTNNENSTCGEHFSCQNHRCVPLVDRIRIDQSIFSLPFILVCLLIVAFIVILILTIGMIKMRSVKCVQFIHPPSQIMTNSFSSSPATITRLSTVPSSSSPCSTLSSSSKSVQLYSTGKLIEKYGKFELFE